MFNSHMCMYYEHIFIHNLFDYSIMFIGNTFWISNFRIQTNKSLYSITNHNVIGASRWNVLLLLKYIQIRLFIIDIAMSNETTISFFLPLYRELRYRQFLPEPQTSPISLASGRSPHANRREPSRNMQMIIIFKSLRYTFLFFFCNILYSCMHDRVNYSIWYPEVQYF